MTTPSSTQSRYKHLLYWLGVCIAYSLFLIALFLLRFFSLDKVHNNYTIHHLVFCICVIILLSITTTSLIAIKHVKDFLFLLLLPLGLCTLDAINQYGHFQACTSIWGQVFHFTTFSLFLVTVKIALLTFWNNKIIKSIVTVIFIGIESFLWFLIILVIVNRLLSGACLDINAVDAICQTYFSEAIYYFFNYNHGLILCFIAFFIIIALPLLNIKLTKSSSQYPSWIKYVVLFYSFILAFTIFVGVKSHYYWHYLPNIYFTLREPYNYRKELQTFKKESKIRENMLENLKQSSSNNHTDGNNGLYALIIGESTCRNFMSCYGYSKPTTPYQNNLRHSGQSVFFDNAYSSHVITICAVPWMITAKHQYLPPEQANTLESNISLIDLANINNYHTAWISNQQKTLSPITVISQAANTQVFLEDKSSKHYDNDLVTAFQKLPNDWTRSLVIFHLTGTHFPYDRTYPSYHTPFPHDFKSYDKSIYFNDENIEKLVECLKQHNASVIAYVSDHADAVSVGRAHDARPERFHKEMTEIPCWIYFSQEYQEQHPELISTLKSNADVPITNDMIFNLFVQLMNMSSPLSSSEYSPTSPDFILKSQAIKTLNGTMIMDNKEWHPIKKNK